MARLFYQGVMTQFDAWHCSLADAPVPTSCLLPHLILAFCLSLTAPQVVDVDSLLLQGTVQA